MSENSKSKNIIATEESYQHPEWLTKDYFSRILKIFYKDSTLEVIAFKTSPALGKCENYVSVITRVLVEFKRRLDLEPQVKSFIVKDSFEASKFLKPFDVYQCEVKFYMYVIPKVYSLLEGIGDMEKIFPEIIHTDKDRYAIIFEDLKESRFVMSDRLKGLDMCQAKLSLRKLAKLHATTAVLNEDNPGMFRSYDYGIFNRHTNLLRPYHEGMLDACIKVVSQWEGYSEYSRKLIALKPKLMEYGKQVFDPIDEHFNVLTHGDFWINNILFKYINDEVEDVMFLDFQFICWGSPAIDLHYFLNTSLIEELQINAQDELIQFYYDILSQLLKDLGYKSKILSYDQFIHQLKENNFYAFTSAFLIHAAVLVEGTEDANLFGDDEKDLEFKRKMYANKKVENNLKKLLPIFDQKGILEIRD